MAMKTVKVLFAVLAAITALLVIAAVLIASLFDPNDYKGVVTDAFAARIGRTLTIERDLELSFFPWLAVETGGITIGSAADFGGATMPFATAERAAARVKLLPLLGRRVEIGTVELDGLQLALARDAELRGNWDDLIAAANAAPAAASNAPREPGAAGVDSFALEGLRIRSGSVSWHENTNELRYTVSNLNFSTGSIGGSNAPVDVDASFDFRDELTGLMVELQASAAAQIGANGSVTATKLDAEVTLHTTNDTPAREFGATAASIVFDRDAQTLQVEGLTTVIAGARAAWRLQGTALLDNPSLQGNVSVAGAPLGGVLEALEWQPPQGVQTRDLGEFTLATDFSFRAEPLEIRVTGVDAQVLGARVRGEGTLAGDDFQGRVDIPEFTPNAAVQSLVRANVPATVDVGALGNLALSTQFGFRAQPREIRVTGVDAQLFGMRVRGEGTLAGDNELKGRIDIPEFTPNAAVQSLLRASVPPTVDVGALGKLAHATRFDANLATGRAALRELKVGAFGASITGELEAIPGTNGNTFQGSVATSRFAPDAFAKAFAALLPANLSPSELGMLQVNTRFVFDSGKDTVTVAPLRA
jgi:AsmA protein